ncbi:amidohydrolase family protein [Sorangium sp. So ce693]|uniref:amidohydrolase family protein n=1 Tax=Sorangium sp. So ce693 TaxID=3133318 RepID=UPI003F5EC40E
MSVSSSHLSLKDGKKTSRSRVVRDKLDYPVIDTDLHTIEFAPILEDYIAKYGGAKSVDEFRDAINRGFGYLSNEWYELTPEQRAAQRSVRPPWWALPTKNTLDLATVSLPSLLHERLGESGTDYAVLFPNVSTFATHVGKEDLRRVLIRAVNAYHADVYRPYADRLTPVAAIPLHTPQEGVEELEFAVRELGLKVALIPGNLRRPIRSVAEKYPSRHHPDVARHANWLDTFGVDSEHNYDPFWAKAVELRTVLTTHSAGMGWTSRSSVSSYMYNHIGHFASASEALAKSLFFSGVTRRFPDLRVGFLEGGAAWGATLFADLVGHWEKRNGRAVQNYNPDLIEAKLLYALYQQYGGEEVAARLGDINAVLGGALGVSNNSRRQPQDAGALDDFAAAGIERIEDIRDRYVPNFYFGSEADDPTIAYAFNTKVNPLGVQLNAFWASDSGHWDVPDLTEVLADTWSLVERGALTEANFRDLVFTHPYNFFAGKNPGFFAGTAVEQKLRKSKAA